MTAAPKLGPRQEVPAGQQITQLKKLISITHQHGIETRQHLHNLITLNERRRGELAQLVKHAGPRPIVKGGPDWSAYQGNVNVSQLALSGLYDLVVRKATEDLTVINSGFAGDWLQMGLHVTVWRRAAYHFAHPEHDPIAQARFFYATVKAAGLGSTDILVGDIEIGATFDLDQWADRFLGELGRLAPLNEIWQYGSVAWRTWLPRPGRREWVADPDGLGPVQGMQGLNGRVVLHQNTFSGRAPGISGPVDLSVVP